MKPKSLSVHHIALKVADLVRIAAFYAETLGLPEIKRQKDEKGNERSVWFDCGGTILMLEEGKPVATENLIALAIQLFERSLWKRRLEKQGVKIESESPYSFYLRDPEGNRLALSHYPDKEALS